MSQWFNRFLQRLSGVKPLPAVSPPAEGVFLPEPSASLPSPAVRRSTPYRNKAGPAYPFGLDEPLVWFSPQDPWTIRDACEGARSSAIRAAGRRPAAVRQSPRDFYGLGLAG